jgi:hypothetical protein
MIESPTRKHSLSFRREPQAITPFKKPHRSSMRLFCAIVGATLWSLCFAPPPHKATRVSLPHSSIKSIHRMIEFAHCAASYDDSKGRSHLGNQAGALRQQIFHIEKASIAPGLPRQFDFIYKATPLF